MNHDFTPSGFFALRTPLLPFEEFLAWGDGLETSGSIGDLDQLGAALERDRARLRARLCSTIDQPEVRGALFLASPSLDDMVDGWMQDPDSPHGHRAERALVGYFSRMCSRPVPFGRFAGTSVGTLSHRTSLVLAPRETYESHSRVDLGYLSTLVQSLACEPALREVLGYRPNSSLYRAAGRIRYVETRHSGAEATHHLVMVEDTEELRAVLHRGEGGATPAELAAAVKADEVSGESARAYVEDLIDAQVLLPDLGSPITGPQPLEGLLDDLARYPEAATAHDVLTQVRSALGRIDAMGLGGQGARYRDAAGLLEGLPGSVELQRLFQVDLVKPAPEATLGMAVVGEALKSAELLRQVSSKEPAELEEFRHDFVARYERREVPLLVALDEEAGVGLGTHREPGAGASPLLRGLDFPRQEDREIRWGPRESVLLRRFAEALVRGSREVVLVERDLIEMAVESPPPLPDAFMVMGQVAAHSQEALDRGEFTFVCHGIEGPSGARLLGRFCHADPILRKHVEEHLRAEEALAPDGVFAEVVHLPEGRLGNILARPALRDYEITYLGRSGMARGRHIPASDLLVSVVGDRIVLRSARLGREVVPRLTSAHNFGRGTLSVYRFLCMLQEQGVTGGLRWEHGPFRDAPFVPRIRVGRVVLALARWRVDGTEIDRLTTHARDEMFTIVQAWRNERQLPRLVTLAENDNGLVVDLENILSVECFVHHLKGRKDAEILEVFPAPDQLIATGPEGWFAHEVIVPVVRRAARPRPTARETPAEPGSRPPEGRPGAGLRRTLPPGSEWLYASLYTGTATADRVLLEAVGPLARESIDSGAADRWFFIRYGEGGWHLRVRLHGEPDALRDRVLPALGEATSPLLEDGRLWRVRLDTYEREVERFGGTEGIEIAERMFHADSKAVLDLLERLEQGDEGADERWRLAVAGSAMLLSDLGLGIHEKLTLTERLRDEFAAEYRSDANLTRQIAERFRKERSNLEPLLNSPEDEDHPLGPGFVILRQRSERIAPLVEELTSLNEEGRLSVPLSELAASHVHMHVNRLLRSEHRAHELVIHDFLARLYRSRAEQEAAGRGRSR
jgi:class I lanthipeptide synthase